MPTKTRKPRAPRTPKFRLHKATGQGFVEFDGLRIYLGRHDHPDAEQRYHRIIGEWIANGRKPPTHREDVSIVELCSAYWDHAKIHYRKPDETPTSELDNVKRAIKAIRHLYGSLLVQDFGPLQLKTVRHNLIEREWKGKRTSRQTVNSTVGTVRRMFKFGVSEGLVEPSVLGALQAVEGLKKGRSQARETDPVTPIPLKEIEAVKPFVSQQVWAMIQLQLLTGARGGELLTLLPSDIDKSVEPWVVELRAHKTSYRGRTRKLYFGARAQNILREFMLRPEKEYLFSPAAAAAERRESLHQARKTPLAHGNSPGSNKVIRPKMKPGALYTAASYRRAIKRACEKAAVPAWAPNRLRHNAATFFRKEYGLEVAQVLLGHATADITQIYAEIDHDKAKRVIHEIG